MKATTDDLPQLPEGWTWTTASEICSSVRDGTHDTPGYVTDGIPLITSKNLKKHGLDFTMARNISQVDHDQISIRSGVTKGDVLFAMIGTIGNPVVVNTNKLFSIKNVGLFKKNEGCLVPEYLMFWLSSPLMSSLLEERELVKGTNQRFVPLQHLRIFPIPVAPLNEQRRIATKLEELFSDLDAAIETLNRVQHQLKRYRQSVLKHAVEGKLTAEWREQHKDKIEPADELLKRILGERRAKWEEQELAKMTAKGKVPKDQNWKKKYNEPEPPHTDGLPELPAGWVWARLDALADLKGGITKDSKRKLPDSRPVPYLRVANVQRAYLDLSEIKYIDALESVISELRLQRWDVLFTEGGDRDKLGRGWVWNDEIPDCIHQNHVFRARLILGNQDFSKLISWFGNSYGQRYFMAEGKQTTNLASINLTKLSAFPVPMPPEEEQAEIVAEIERCLTIADVVHKTIVGILIRAEQLRQSVLKSAFSGKLFAQDPNDEPATILLDRIRAEREKEANGNGKQSESSKADRTRTIARKY